MPTEKEKFRPSPKVTAIREAHQKLMADPAKRIEAKQHSEISAVDFNTRTLFNMLRKGDLEPETIKYLKVKLDQLSLMCIEYPDE